MLIKKIVSILSLPISPAFGVIYKSIIGFLDFRLRRGDYLLSVVVRCCRFILPYRKKCVSLHPQTG